IVRSVKAVVTCLSLQVATWVLLAATSSLSAGTSNSLLDVSPDGRFLLAANADNGSVTVVDLLDRKIVREIPVGAKPESAAWIGNGPLAAAALYRDRQIVLFNVETGDIANRIDVKAEPYGLVVNQAGTRAWV